MEYSENTQKWLNKTGTVMICYGLCIVFRIIVGGLFFTEDIIFIGSLAVIFALFQWTKINKKIISVLLMIFGLVSFFIVAGLLSIICSLLIVIYSIILLIKLSKESKTVVVDTYKNENANDNFMQVDNFTGDNNTNVNFMQIDNSVSENNTNVNFMQVDNSISKNNGNEQITNEYIDRDVLSNENEIVNEKGSMADQLNDPNNTGNTNHN